MEVHLDRITFRYQRSSLPAVDDVTLTVASGEFLVVLGESGAGKTTLLRIIAGLETPDQGGIYLGGVWANDVPVGKRDVQMIFQGLALWPHMKVLDDRDYSNITLPLKTQQRWTQQEISLRARQVAARVRLSPHLFDRTPDQLSGGEQQRVALARALVAGARVLVLDDPLSHLDPITRVELRGEIRRLHNESGATTIFVTHRVADAFELGDRIAVMRNGRILQIGAPEMVRSRPVDEYVKEFLAAL